MVHYTAFIHGSSLLGTNFIWKLFQGKSNKPILPAHLENIYVKYSDQKRFYMTYKNLWKQARLL